MEDTMEEDSKPAASDGDDIDNETTSEDSKSISEKAFQELEVSEDNLYLMIQYSSVSSGMSRSRALEGLSQEDELVIARSEGEIDARYAVDKSFANQLMKDLNFRDELKRMKGRKNDESGVASESKESNVVPSDPSTTFALCLHSAFENRYQYLCALRVWIKRRWRYLELNAERTGLSAFFGVECDRFLRSIPPTYEFRNWIYVIEEVKVLFESEIAKIAVPKGHEELPPRPTTSYGRRDRKRPQETQETAPESEKVGPRPVTSDGRDTCGGMKGSI